MPPKLVSVIAAASARSKSVEPMSGLVTRRGRLVMQTPTPTTAPTTVTTGRTTTRRSVTSTNTAPLTRTKQS